MVIWVKSIQRLTPTPVSSTASNSDVVHVGQLAVCELLPVFNVLDAPFD